MSFEPPQAPPPPPSGWGNEPSPDDGPPRPAFSAGPTPAEQGRTPGKATAALVLGIIGILILPLVCSVLAIVLGLQAKGDIARDPSLGGAGVAQAGFVLGIVGLVLGVLMGVLVASGTLEI